jgi:hypothetical protein
VVPPAQVQEQLERILHSEVFRNAATLQRLLRYITSKAMEDPSGELKEYTIGVESLGRGPDYDPKVDTVVRVEVLRLRQKLAEYYKSEGAGDPILVGIPKGHYHPRFSVLNPPVVNGVIAGAELLASAPERREPGRGQSEKRTRILQVTQFSFHRAVIALGAITIFFFGLAVGTRWVGWRNARRDMVSATQMAPSAVKGADSVRDFWASFLRNETIAVLGYPDAVFLIDETNDLFRFRQGAVDDRGAPVNHSLAEQFASNPSLVGRAGPLFYENGYTGVGELEGTTKLACLFTRMGLPLIVKRARELTVKDFKEHNIILLGSSFQNKAVAQIPVSGDFQFNQPDRRRELWRGRILNLHPHAGEVTFYQTERDPVTQILLTDYALITVQPGAEPSRFVAVLAGLDTAGTAGAIEFATSQAGIEALNKSLASLGVVAKGREPMLFQAVLKVDLANGRDVRNVSLATAHMLRQGSTSVPRESLPLESRRTSPPSPTK